MSEALNVEKIFGEKVFTRHTLYTLVSAAYGNYGGKT